LQDKYGREQVFILTAATYEYAAEITKRFNFGIPESQILDRTTTKNHAHCKRNPEVRNYLIDDLDYYERNTRKKLKALGLKKTKLIKVDAFHHNLRDTDPEDYDHKKEYDRIINEIESNLSR
jgi:hypothetical protein